MSVADDQSSLRSDKLMLPEEMPERLKDIVRKKQSLLAQLWKDQRNMIQYERSYLTACPHGNVLKGGLSALPGHIVLLCYTVTCIVVRPFVTQESTINVAV